MFTPKDLQEVAFDKAMFGGYDMQMVDEFLEPLTQDYITLYKENSVLKSKLKILVEKLEEYRSQESSTQKALVNAQNSADAIIAEAQRKASRILNDAESRESDADKSKDYHEHKRNRNRKYYREARLKIYSHYNSTDKHTGRTKRHTKKHIHKILKLCYVICHSRYKRAGREFVNI